MRTDASLFAGVTSNGFDIVSSGMFDEKRDFEAFSLSFALIHGRKDTLEAGSSFETEM